MSTLLANPQNVSSNNLDGYMGPCSTDALRITPADLFFGLIFDLDDPNTTPPEKLTVTNVSNGVVQIKRVSITDAADSFLLVPPTAYPDYLASGQSFEISVGYIGEGTGQKTGLLEIRTEEDKIPYTVGLSAQAISGSSEAPIKLEQVNLLIKAAVDAAKNQLSTSLATGLAAEALSRGDKDEQLEAALAGIREQLDALLAEEENPATGGGGGTKVKPFRLANETTFWPAVFRMYRLGIRDMELTEGEGDTDWDDPADNGKWRSTALPWKGLKPGGDPTKAEDYISQKGSLFLPEDGLPGAGNPLTGLRLRGTGRKRTRIKQVGNFAISCNSKSNIAANNVHDVYFGDFSIEGLGDPVATQTGHIFAIAGASNMTWERVEFLAFNGDAVCFWPSPNPLEETHNYFLTFRDCQFDGVNSKNRNAISVEDGTYGRIENCRFIRCCTDDDGVSVAAIDFEPRDKTWYQIAFWTIDACTFIDINRGGVAFYLNGPDYYTQPVRGMFLTNCTFIRCKRLWDFSGVFTDQFNSVKTPQAITVSGNHAEDSGDIRFLGMLGVMVHHNTLVGIDVVKFGDAVAKGNMGVIVDDNLFLRCKSNILILHDDDTEFCMFTRNTIFDCGIQYNTSSPGYVMIARRGKIGLRVEGNRIYNPNGRLKAGFIMTDSATYGPTGMKRDNPVFGVPYTVSDTWNPAGPTTGARFEYTVAGQINSNQRLKLDVAHVAVQGNKPWVMSFNKTLDEIGLGAVEVSYLNVSAFVKGSQVLRIFIDLGPGNWFIPAGTVLIAQEVA